VRRVTLIAIGVLAVGAATAVGAGLKTKSASVTVDANETASIAAKCKRGTNVVSGGFSAPVTPNTSEGPQIFPTASTKAGKRRWTASGFNDASSDEGELIAHAYCRAQAKRLETESESTTIDFLEANTLTATCEPGRRAVSGGFEGDNAPSEGFFLVHSSHRTDARTWSATGVNFGLATDADFSVFVHCLKGGKRLTTESASTSVPENVGDDYGAAAATAKCPKGRQAVSGGFEGSPFGDSAGDVFPHISRKVGGRRWKVEAVNSNSGASGTLTAYVYCEKKKKKKNSG
jgi:hypothetical protein